MHKHIAVRKVGALVIVVGGLGAFAGCTSDEPTEVVVDDAVVAEELALIGPGSGTRCTIKGQPPVTTGCEEGQFCLPYACTQSYPPTCVGTCQDTYKAKATRCDVNGDPPVTTGCEAYQTCAVEACTNSIPPHCWGHCE